MNSYVSIVFARDDVPYRLLAILALSFLISVSAFSGTSTFPWSSKVWFPFEIYRQSHRCRNHCFLIKSTHAICIQIFNEFVRFYCFRAGWCSLSASCHSCNFVFDIRFGVFRNIHFSVIIRCWFSFWIYRQSHRCRNHCFLIKSTNAICIQIFDEFVRFYCFRAAWCSLSASLHFRFWYPFRHFQEHPLFRGHQFFDFHFGFIGKVTVVEMIVFW